MVPRRVHQAAHRLDDGIERRASGVSGVCAEARNRAVHQPRIQLAQPRGAEPEAFERARLHVLDQHVGGRDQAREPDAARIGPEVQRETALVAVAHNEEMTGAAAVRRPRTRAVAVARLDLDHVSAKAREVARRQRRRRELADFEYAQSGEWRRCRLLPPQHVADPVQPRKSPRLVPRVVGRRYRRRARRLVIDADECAGHVDIAHRHRIMRRSHHAAQRKIRFRRQRVDRHDRTTRDTRRGEHRHQRLERVA